MTATTTGFSTKTIPVSPRRCRPPKTWRVNSWPMSDRCSAIPAQAAVQECVASLMDELDHRNLNVEVPGLADVPKTTEMLARYIFQRARETLPLHRVRLH